MVKKYNYKHDMFYQIKILVLLSAVRCSQQIIGGEPAALIHWPNIVLIKYITGHFCGGSQFLPGWVVTSAQCIDPNLVPSFWIQGIALNVSSLDQNKTGGLFIPRSEIRQILGHPGFTVDRSGITINDIALIRLPDNIPNSDTIHDIPLAKDIDQPANADNCYTAGFGMNIVDVYQRTVHIPDAFFWPRILRSVRQEMVPLTYCLGAIEHNINYNASLDPERQICTQGRFNYSGPTYGDFGGPLICGNRQYGISSVSAVPSSPPFPRKLYTIYTDLRYYQTWIQSIVDVERTQRFFESLEEGNQIDLKKSEGYKLRDNSRNEKARIETAKRNAETIKSLYQLRIDNIINFGQKFIPCMSNIIVCMMMCVFT